MYVIYAIIAITFIVSLIVTPKVIKWSIKHNIVDIPKDSRRIHSKPMPRIGGLAIVISMVVGFLIYFLFTKDIESIALGKKFLGYAIGAFFIFLMGFIDDVYGLRARYKFWFQLAAAIVVFAFGIRVSGFKIPFIQEETIALSTWLDFILTTVWIICITCALNLIDGLDGLSGGLCAIAFLAYGLISWGSYWIQGYQDIGIFCFILVGCIMGFLVYNSHPAKVFMGDTGSLSLGATLATVAILTSHEVSLAIIGGIFVIETLSVIIQIFSVVIFKKRIFLMSPIHHHFERLGWSEGDIVKLFWIGGFILSLIALIYGVWL